jgi:hypothetical protein
LQWWSQLPSADQSSLNLLFESQVILFPSTTNSVSKALLLPQSNGYGDEDIFEYGDEQQAEQLLQILNSGEIRDSVIQKFDLMAHYEIDEDTKYRRTKLFKEYASKIEFARTQFMSVEINVMDTDPHNCRRHCELHLVPSRQDQTQSF